MIRKIAEINEELCNGCGQCIPNCAEGALQIVNGKARLVKDSFCDGLGACLGHCSKGAITIMERRADCFIEKAVKPQSELPPTTKRHIQKPAGQNPSCSLTEDSSTPKSSLHQWPVQLRLVSAKASFFAGADLLLVADCVPFAYPGLHLHLLPGKSVLVGCPKFDDTRSYANKLGEILRLNEVRSMTIVSMEVPCCYGLSWIAETAMETSGKKIPVQRYVVAIKGDLKEVGN